MHDRQLLRKHQYLHYVRSGQRGNFYDMPLLCLMIRSTLVFHRYCLYCSYFYVIVSFFSYFYFDLSQPYYWRLAGVEKEKSPVKKICPRENLSYFPFGLFSPAQKIFPLLKTVFANFFQFLGHCELHDMYKYRLAVRMLNIIYLLFKMNRCKKIVLKRKRKEHTG